jgi:aminoglycoside phosphotransferase (APT) family kinase protein
MAQPPGRLIGAGRTADVYALGRGRVLRRYRDDRSGRDVAAEAAAMAHLAGAGYPVPEVYEADGRDLVLERLDGRDMLANLARAPWRVRRHARTLARLHDRLHEIEAPPGMGGCFAAGDRVVHLGLHPGNVMLTSRGPVVIDWAGARAGLPAADVATTYVIMLTSEVDDLPRWVRPAARTLRGAMLREFLATVGHDPAPVLAAAARARLADRSVRPAEAELLRRVAGEAG